MEVYNIENMKNGWFIGNFNPCVINNENFEIAFQKNEKDKKTEDHFHKISTEINLIVSGKMIINGKELKKGEIFILFPGEISKSYFLEDSELIVVKIPSEKNDKYLIGK